MDAEYYIDNKVKVTNQLQVLMNNNIQQTETVFTVSLFSVLRRGAIQHLKFLLQLACKAYSTMDKDSQNKLTSKNLPWLHS